MTVNILPGKASGTVEAPPSKSYAHRMLLCAALAGERAAVENLSDSEDIQATLACIRALGGEYHREENQIQILRGITGSSDSYSTELRSEEHCPIVCPCGESGSTLRFFVPLALTLCGGAVFTGSKRLMERGIGVYEKILTPKEIRFEHGQNKQYTQKNNAVPEEEIIRVCGKLVPGEYALPGNVSSQFVSGMLFALPLLEGDSTLTVLPPVESESYIKMTLEVLRLAGIQISAKQTQDAVLGTEKTAISFFILGGQRYRTNHFYVEGDWSNASFLYALNSMGGHVNVTGLNPESLQGDKICGLLFKMLLSSDGASVPENRCCAEPDIKEKTEPENTPEVVIDLSDCPDLGPVLFAMAAAGEHGGTFTGIRRLRLKESDRVQAMADELKKFGIRTAISENCAVILPGKLHKPERILKSHNDHRIAMALSLLCTETGGTINGAETVRKSWPEFFKVLRTLGLRVSEEDTENGA